MEDIVRIGTMFTFVIVLGIILVALFDRGRAGEAPMGSFEARNFNTGWEIVNGDSAETVELPYTVPDAKKGDVIRIRKSLPYNLDDGMNLMIRSSMQDVDIYIAGYKRASYSCENIDGLTNRIPSAYVVCELDEADSGKTIEIVIGFHTNTRISGITMSHGNNVWFDVIKDGLAINIVAVVVLAVGLVLCLSSLVIGNRMGIHTFGPLGLLMTDMALWMFSESTIRQFIFGRPSLSTYFAYLTMEMVGIFACMYFDEVQHRVYHSMYTVLECIMMTQIVANVILDAADLAMFYDTMFMSHFWTGMGALLAYICLINDIRNKRIYTYWITAIGMALFALIAMGEIVGFYINRYHLFGGYVGVALLFLMSATIGQMIYDELQSTERAKKTQTGMTVNTIETIAGSIDAKDEYTGGHSERVAIYAERLAREMAADYDFTEQDILNVRYVAQMHDIGKIGVADGVLNKAGRLTDEEFSLMKKHTEIGYEIMSSMGTFIDGMLDGIRHHHERFDGKGYPDGLSDTDIPLIARILCLADSYDAMTSNRVYRKRLSDEEVREELLRCAGTQFDPALTEIFVRLLDRGELRANIVDGVASDDSGEIPPSAMLENILHKDLLDGKKILHASHVRMACYMLKLMEKKGKFYSVLFVGPFGSIGDTLKECIGNKDINIRYTEEINMVALFDRTKEELSEFESKIRESMQGAEIRVVKTVTGKEGMS